MKMIDVGEKDRTSRVAIARAELRCSRETLKLLNEGRLEKGDALAAALTIYDLAKRHDRGMEVVSVRLVRKSGGRSGEWNRNDEAPQPRAEEPLTTAAVRGKKR
jgi:molybdenum cofactor biosynthesis enzyme